MMQHIDSDVPVYPELNRFQVPILSRAEMRSALLEPNRAKHPPQYDPESGRALNAGDRIVREAEIDGDIVRFSVDKHGSQLYNYSLTRGGHSEEYIYAAGEYPNTHNMNSDTARGRGQFGFPQGSTDPRGILPLHGYADKCVFTYHETLSNDRRVVMSLKGEEAATIVPGANRDSALFVIHELDDEGGIITTLQFTGVGEYSPAQHTYLNIDGNSAAIVASQAEVNTIDPETVNPKTLKQAFTAMAGEVLRQQARERVLTEDGLRVNLDTKGRKQIYYLPMAGYTDNQGSQGSQVFIWSDSPDYFAFELTTAGSEVLGTGSFGIIELRQPDDVGIVAWRTKAVLNS